MRNLLRRSPPDMIGEPARGRRRMSRQPTQPTPEGGGRLANAQLAHDVLFRAAGTRAGCLLPAAPYPASRLRSSVIIVIRLPRRLVGKHRPRGALAGRLSVEQAQRRGVVERVDAPNFNPLDRQAAALPQVGQPLLAPGRRDNQMRIARLRLLILRTLNDLSVHCLLWHPMTDENGRGAGNLSPLKDHAYESD